MADETEISWTDSTFNPWIGCAKVSPGCDHCYAETLDRRKLWSDDVHWGPGTRPMAASENSWKLPLRWQRKAARDGTVNKVFCGSMHDFADTRAPAGARQRLWELVRETPDLRWQMLTKRPKNIMKSLPKDWGNGYHNVCLGVTVEDVEHGLPRIDILRNIPCAMRFLSIEPLLEDIGKIDLTDIGWVIVGGESGRGARPMELDWVLSIREQCTQQNVPFFYKQKGLPRGHGDCLIDGVEVKEWPAFLLHPQPSVVVGPEPISVITSTPEHTPTAQAVAAVSTVSLPDESIAPSTRKVLSSNAQRQQRYKQAHKMTPIDLPARVLDHAKDLKSEWSMASIAKTFETALIIADSLKSSEAVTDNSNRIFFVFLAANHVGESTSILRTHRGIVMSYSRVLTIEMAHKCIKYAAVKLIDFYEYQKLESVTVLNIKHGCAIYVTPTQSLSTDEIFEFIGVQMSQYLTTVFNETIELDLHLHIMNIRC